MINRHRRPSKKNNLKSIADPAGRGERSPLAPPEFKERPQGILGPTKTYGVTWQLPPAQGRIIPGRSRMARSRRRTSFSTDPAIAANGFVTPTDDQRLFGSQNVAAAFAKSKNSAEVTAPRRRVGEVDDRRPVGPAQADRHRQGGPADGRGEALADNGLG